MRGAGVLDVAHHVGALPAVAVVRGRAAARLRRVRSTPLDGAEVVRQLVQEALRPPAPAGGAGRVRAVAAEEDRGEPAAVVDVGGALLLAGRAHDRLAEAVLLRATGEAVGDHDRVARRGRGAERALDGARDRAEVVGVLRARAGQRDDLDVRVRAPQLVPMSKRIALVPPSWALSRRWTIATLAWIASRQPAQPVRAVGGERVDDLELRLAGRRGGVGGVAGRGLAAPARREAVGAVGGGLRGHDDLGEADVLQLAAGVEGG